MARPSALDGLQVDDEPGLGRLHDRQIGGLHAVEDAADINAGLIGYVLQVVRLAQQAALRGKIPPTGGRQPIMREKFR